MRISRTAAVAALSVALVFAFASPALARGRHRPHHDTAPYRVSAPALIANRVTAGVTFEATGVVLPAFAADDTSTTVSIEVYGPFGRVKDGPGSTVLAALSASADTGTAYAASITLSAPGEYTLVAAVSRDGKVLVRSKGREVRVVLPYRVSKPGVLSSRVETGTSFDATGVITPAIAADDAVTQVSVLVFSLGRHEAMTQVASFAATLADDGNGGSVYTSSVSVDTPGRYVLIAVVTQGDIVVGRSGARTIVVGAPAHAPHLDRSTHSKMRGHRG